MKDQNDNQTQDLVNNTEWPFPTTDYSQNKKPLRDLDTLLADSGFTKKENTMQAIQFIDEVKDAPIDADSILTDDQLGRAGLVKIEAFVRTKTSAAASRKAKQRAKEKAEGIQTVTLTVPTAAKEQLKAVAAEVASGKSLVEAVQSVTSHGQVTKSHAQMIGERVLALTGWKLIIAKAIGIL